MVTLCGRVAFAAYPPVLGSSCGPGVTSQC